MKNSLERFKRRLEWGGERISEAEDIGNYKVWWVKRKKTKKKRTEPKVFVGYHQMDQYMHYGSPRKRERERRRKIFWRNDDKNFLKFRVVCERTNLRSPMIRFKRPILRHIINLLKIKDKGGNNENSKRNVTHHLQGIPNKIMGGFSSRTLQARRQ